MAKAKKGKKAAKGAASTASQEGSVLVTMRGSYGYTDPETKQRRYYGPGDVEVPAGLAKALGLKVKEVTRASKAAKAKPDSNPAKPPETGGAADATDSGAQAGASDAGAGDADSNPGSNTAGQ